MWWIGVDLGGGVVVVDVVVVVVVVVVDLYVCVGVCVGVLRPSFVVSFRFNLSSSPCSYTSRRTRDAIIHRTCSH